MVTSLEKNNGTSSSLPCFPASSYVYRSSCVQVWFAEFIILSWYTRESIDWLEPPAAALSRVKIRDSFFGKNKQTWVTHGSDSQVIKNKENTLSLFIFFLRTKKKFKKDEENSLVPRFLAKLSLVVKKKTFKRNWDKWRSRWFVKNTERCGKKWAAGYNWMTFTECGRK
jgi:hypothetical protein